MKRGMTILCAFLAIYGLMNAAPLKNIPLKLIQPNGTEIKCYSSGDEFYHWLHDSLGNVIILDSITNYYCYRVETTDSLVVVGNNADNSIQYSKNAYKFPNNRQKWVELYNKGEKWPYKFSFDGAKSIRVINNIVIFITFSDQSDYTTSQRSSISALYNDYDYDNPANSLKQYYWVSSYEQLWVTSSLYPNGTSVLSYHDNHPRDYYCPYSNSNPNGYQLESTGVLREEALLASAISEVYSQIPSSLNLDTDDDGYVDNVSFIIKGGPTEWNSLLWPHHSSLTWQVRYINGKRVYNYNLLLSDNLSCGTLCHEFGHTLGLPDLYHGYADPATGQQWNPVGSWDIMAVSQGQLRQMSGYMKQKYLHWIDDLPWIIHSGRYTLAPISSFPHGYRIHINSSIEYLYLEYRKYSMPYDTGVPNSGLLISRINPIMVGNIDAVEGGGVNDEVYVYRPDGTFTSEGYLPYAPFCVELGDTVFNPYTNPQEFLSNGNYGNIYISNVSECDSTISFDVKICSSNDVTYNQNSTIPSYTNARSITTSGAVEISSSTTFEASESIILNNGFKVANGTSFNAIIIPCE